MRFQGQMQRKKFDSARRMRRSLTGAEAVLWARLNKHQTPMRFRSQHPMLGYIADFYCPKVKLCVEVDGGYHETPERQSLDRQRDAAMRKHGVTVLRFTNAQVVEDVDAVVEAIVAWYRNSRKLT